MEVQSVRAKHPRSQQAGSGTSGSKRPHSEDGSAVNGFDGGDS